MVKPYRRQSFQRLKPAFVQKEQEQKRGSRQERGYDSDWERERLVTIKAQGGLCQECLRRGYIAAFDVVDHIIPLRDAPHLRLSQPNLELMCNVHHNGLKRRIEAYARSTAQIKMLQRWMKHPETRPAQFQIVRYGPMKEPTNGDLSGQDSQSEPDIPTA